MPENTGVNAFCLHFQSNKEVFIENYRKLVLYTKEEIIIDTKDCRVHILGNSLFISFYSKYEMIITGNVYQVLFR